MLALHHLHIYLMSALFDRSISVFVYTHTYTCVVKCFHFYSIAFRWHSLSLSLSPFYHSFTLSTLVRRLFDVENHRGELLNEKGYTFCSKFLFFPTTKSIFTHLLKRVTLKPFIASEKSLNSFTHYHGKDILTAEQQTAINSSVRQIWLKE